VTWHSTSSLQLTEAERPSEPFVSAQAYLLSCPAMLEYDEEVFQVFQCHHDHHHHLHPNLHSQLEKQVYHKEKHFLIFGPVVKQMT
jgi:hypothetical protein